MPDQPSSPPPDPRSGSAEQISQDGTPWLDGFRRSLVAPATLAFVDWAAGTAGSEIVLDRGRFDPEDLKPWLGDLAILQWDADAGDYRYRVFGTRWAASLGQDFTGRTLSVWPRKVACAIRDRVHAVAVRRVPAGAHVAATRYVSSQVERGHTVYEQVVWPIRYGPGAPAAVLALAVPVPKEAGLNAVTLRAQTGHLGRWFSADGMPLTPSPPVAHAGGPRD